MGKVNETAKIETVNVVVKNVRLFENEDRSSVQLVLNKAIKGFIIKDGNAVESDVESISVNRSALTAQLCSINDDIALYRATIGKSFDQRQFALLLFGAELTIERELVAAGETRGDYTFEHDCYTTILKSIKISSRTTKMLDNALTL